MKKILLALAGAAMAIGLSVAVTTPAQAFSTFIYTANCPGNAKAQQLKVTNNGPNASGIAVESKTLFQNNWYTGWLVEPGDIAYIPVQNYDTVQYRFSGYGDLQWFYSVGCYY